MFLDIEGAFDNITNDALLQGMESHKIPEHIISWYKHYLFNRTCFSTLGNETIERKIAKGTPQKGILSPPSWNMNYDKGMKGRTMKQKQELISKHQVLNPGSPSPQPSSNKKSKLSTIYIGLPDGSTTKPADKQNFSFKNQTPKSQNKSCNVPKKLMGKQCDC